MIYALLGLAISVGMGFCAGRIAGFLTTIHHALWRDQ